jgi:hypothetical protein
MKKWPALAQRRFTARSTVAAAWHLHYQPHGTSLTATRRLRMSVQELQHELRDALTKLETALGTPVLAGELTDWVQSVRKELGKCVNTLCGALAQAHGQQYADILQQDLEMARQVEQLKQEDAAILEDVKRFGEELDCLAVVAKAVGRHESQAQEMTDRTVQSGLMLVARIRKQETAITTWLVEAYQRDRGIVD